MKILVIDVGTSSMRGIVFADNGSQLESYQVKYDVKLLENGYIEQDPQDFRKALIEIISTLSPYDIDAIALTSQRSSVIPVDEKGKPLCDAIMWQDRRTVECCHELEKQNELIFSRCGSRVNPVFSGSKMKWLKENQREIYDAASKLLVIPDYLVYIMSGKFVSDQTYGSRSLLMNLKSGTWDHDQLALFGIDEEKLCELHLAGSIIAKVSEEFANLTGIKSGLPIISAGGDQQCGMIGQGAVKEGICSLTLGTGAFLLTPCIHYPEHLEMDVVCNASSIQSQYILEASVLTCSSALEWFHRTCGSDIDNFYEWVNETALNTDADGCIVLPYFQGRSTPDWNSHASAMFYNITLKTTREMMLKALLEGICLSITENIEIFRKYAEVNAICISGGMSASSGFLQLLADVSGCEIICSNNLESTASGAFMVAGCALGLFKDMSEAYAAVNKQEKAQRYVADVNKHMKYNELRKQMQSLYQKTMQN